MFSRLNILTYNKSNNIHKIQQEKNNLEFYSYRLKSLYYNKLVILTCSNIFNQKKFFFSYFLDAFKASFMSLVGIYSQSNLRLIRSCVKHQFFSSGKTTSVESSTWCEFGDIHFLCINKGRLFVHKFTSKIYLQLLNSTKLKISIYKGKYMNSLWKKTGERLLTLRSKFKIFYYC